MSLSNLIDQKIDTKNVLVVDDQPDNLFLIEAILDEPSYMLTCLESGKAALDIVTQLCPDLILLDVMMPEMDGYTVTRIIRENTKLPYIPILLITAHDQSSVVEGLDAGADDFIRKPFDVNELRARVRSLLRLKQSMDSQNHMIRQRDDFVARLTHDLRTPLVAANRVLDFCRNHAFGEIAQEANEAIANVMLSNKNLLDMVNTLLEVYRHEAGKKNLTYSTFNFADLTEAVLKELQILAVDKNLDCRLCDDDGILDSQRSDFQVQGDALELRRVLTNLIGNAIKFTDEGFVHLRLEKHPSPPPLAVEAGIQNFGGPWISMEVKDSGVGIAPEDQPQIFAWFRQGTNMRAGSGLGLHLAHRIVTSHGGTITVDSTPGKGSTFTLYLPTSPYNLQKQ
ncbi:hybrid sensor histidine kinase/response regulator [Leptolyngbya sp. FACHB-16]|uniref:hybrid sensor histidine kinase/response regulator n=1 Tax=unclassified Leptolyngbya TaxID=2650499 RepID=UPI001683468F|nr:hybrid sensor histidine kinase/response regulator [Leptolyngbya sp. FACHB-16]MBD2157411.1 hybrid sensor histidine kinase/response regulator [Leptolyngbya sp. FACHB-16]